MEPLRFLGNYSVLTSVYSRREKPAEGEVAYQKVEKVFDELASRVQSLPDSVEIVYSSEMDAGIYKEEYLSDVATISLATRYGETYTESLRLPIINKRKNGYDYNPKATYVVSQDPEQQAHFIKKVLDRAEHLARLFKAKTKSPYQLP